MKKIMLGLAIAGMMAFTSTGVHAQTATAAKENIAIPEPPKFTSEDVNKGVGELVKLIKEYAPAIKSNDATALAAFGPKMQAWEQGASTWLTSLSPEEQTKFQGYMQQVGAVLMPSGPAAAPVQPAPVQKATPVSPVN